MGLDKSPFLCYTFWVSIKHHVHTQSHPDELSPFVPLLSL